MSNPPPAGVASIERVWDPAMMQTADLRPDGSHAAMVVFSDMPGHVDAGRSGPAATALAQALVDRGLVVGRWFEGSMPARDARFIGRPAQNPVSRWIDERTGAWTADLVETRSPAVVADLLDQGWDLQEQALLVLEPGTDAAPAEAVDALRRSRNWRAFALAAPVAALVAPGVDGAAALLASGSEETLLALLAGLRSRLVEAGFAVLP